MIKIVLVHNRNMIKLLKYQLLCMLVTYAMMLHKIRLDNYFKERVRLKKLLWVLIIKEYVVVFVLLFFKRMKRHN
jgi:hypothetical protein